MSRSDCSADFNVCVSQTYLSTGHQGVYRIVTPHANLIIGIFVTLR